MDNNQQLSDEGFNNRTISIALRISFIAFMFLLSYLILKPFLLMVVWGIIIAVGVFPIFSKFSNILGNRNKLSSIILTLTALALIITPTVLMLDSTIGSVKTLTSQYQKGTLKIPPPSDKIAKWPVIGKPISQAWQLASNNIKEAVKTFEPQIREYSPKVIHAVSGLGGTILLSILSIIIAGVLLLQAESSKKTTDKVFRFLVGKNGEELTKLTILTIRSVVQGVLGIAVIQSMAAGGLFLIFDIPAAGIWALIVLILAVIQLPPTLIMLPIAIYGFSVMSTTPAVIFLVLSIIISAADTFLKPIFLGRGVDVPMLVILLGAIGGMVVFGILGLFIGAVILAIAYKIFQVLIDNSI
ncbi:MAG: AI-2E family transporter [Deltaproteobacteria bacterium]|nr:MAG: AI-2E family transporter [Deltaproteobacteria bacterium]